jgi:predicted AAA+ superfamily ATPase
MLDRFCEEDLGKWLRKPHRKPLVVRGARQVGKSTAIRKFARQNDLRLFEINLERHPDLAAVFASLNPKKILREIEFTIGQGSIHPEDSLLFLDEIQGVPQALASLRYFFEEMPELAVVSAGSLLEFTLADHCFPMPVGRVEYFHLGPMLFEEFLHALGADDLVQLLRSFDGRGEFPRAAHARLWEVLREFLLVGGMPEAVRVFIEQRDFASVIEIQESILQTYRDDFSKYARGSDLVRLRRILDFTGQHLGEKVKFSNIDRDSQSRDLRKALDLLLKAGVILQACHTHGDGPPLAAQEDSRVFKLYALDIGLHNRTIGLTALPDRTFFDQRFVHEGKLAEQFIAQHLAFQDSPLRPPSLHYWLREGRSSNAEVDFLTAWQGRVLPVEVKAGKAGTLKSLVQFVQEKKIATACRFDGNLPSYSHCAHRTPHGEVEFDLLSLPLYLVGQLPRLQLVFGGK